MLNNEQWARYENKCVIGVHKVCISGKRSLILCTNNAVKRENNVRDSVSPWHQFRLYDLVSDQKLNGPPQELF